MVESIEHFPPEFYAPALCEVKILQQGCIKIPETGTTNRIRPRLHIPECPRPGIAWSIVCPERWIVSKSGLKGSRIDPIRDLLGFGAMSAEMGIADEVAPASRPLESRTRLALLLERARRARNGQRQAPLGVEITT